MRPVLGRDEVGLPRAEARSPGLVVFVIAVVLLTSRAWLATTALHGSELTTDEADLTLMSLDRYFGLPMANTHWPAVTNQMLMVPVIGVDFLLSGQPRNANGFAAYAGAIYRDPARLVFVHRLLVAALTTLATCIFAWTLRRRGAVVMIAAALLLQNVHLITYGTLGLGNGPAVAAMIGCVAAMLHCGDARKRSLLAGLLFGLALASRNTSVLLLPVLLGAIWQMGRSPRERAAILGVMIAATIAGSSPAWSLALLEPIRWLKANLGNFVKIGPPVGLLAALRVLLSAAGVGMWLVTLTAGAWLIVRRRQRPLVIGWLAAFVIAVVISARSPLVETRYFDAIAVAAVALCIVAINDGLAVAAIQSLNQSRAVPGPILGGENAPTPGDHWWAAGVLAVVSLLAAIGIWQSISRFNASREGLRPEERAVAGAIPSANGLTIVDRILLAPLKLRTSSASLRTHADQTDAAVRAGDALGEFVTRYKLDRDVAAVFAGDLTEKEQGDIARNRVAALAPPTGRPLDLIACGDSNSAQRYGVMPTAAVPGMLRDGRAEQAILRAESVAGLDVAGLHVQPMGGGKYVRIRR